MVMQAADLRNLNHLPEAHFLDRSGLWRILLKRQVGAILMVIVKIAPEDSPQMRFPENDDMVQAIATYGDEPFTVRILPRAPGRCHDFIDANRLNPFSKFFSINPVTIPQQIPWFAAAVFQSPDGELAAPADCSPLSCRQA